MIDGLINYLCRCRFAIYDKTINYPSKNKCERKTELAF